MGRETDHLMLSCVDKAMDNLHAKVVVCCRTSYAGIVDDLDPKINPEVLAKLDAMYWEFAGWTSCDTLMLCTDSENLRFEIFSILDFITKPQSLHKRIECKHSWPKCAKPDIASMLRDGP